MSATRNGGASAHQPFDEARLRDLFQRLSDYPSVALAVSGGADSMALMLLVKRWRDLSSLTKPEITVLTVDHGLRTESAAEAKWVEERSAELGFSHQALVWTGAKPPHGLQAAARSARYDLLAGFCRDHSIPAIVMAHTIDDQAETMMMRLARGSGLDGLSGMASVTDWEGIHLLRPLLTASRAELEAFLKEQHQDWLEDPTNRDESYERVRVRRALQAARKLGISNEKLSLSARRLGRAREALDLTTAAFLKSSFAVHEAGFGHMACDRLLLAPEELALRALIRMTNAFGGQSASPQLSKIENAYAALKLNRKNFTLGGCEFAFDGGQILIFREYGRIGHEGTQRLEGQKVIWDERFLISLATAAMTDLEIRPLGAEGIRAIKKAKGDFQPVPRTAALTLPSIWRDGELVYVPHAHFAAGPPESWLSGASAKFVNAPILFAKCPEIAR
jgi:tRNA(Ile)-lysidine synthase